MSLPYDKADPISIEKYAKRLLNRSLHDVFEEKAIQLRIGKGKLGQLIEELFFEYKPNSDARPDFEEAGVELKTTPLKKVKRGFVAKERLVFNIIDYHKEHNYTFQQSSFWQKNALLLLMFYLYEKEQLDIDHIFKIIRLWRFPVNDLKIIKDDWLKIVQKIKEGKAHEISEGDTLYLGACTKGANKGSTRSQPFSNIQAKQRAFSLKPNYLNFIIHESLFRKEFLPDTYGYETVLEEATLLAAEPPARYSANALFESEPIVKTIDDYRDGETFETLVIRKFEKHCGKSEKALIDEFDIDLNNSAKNKFEVISKAILGVRKKHVEEFVKADVLLKTIRIESNDSIKESMSFRQIKYKQIVTQEWEESDWFEDLNRRIFFIVFRSDLKGIYRLQKVLFWSIPQYDLDILESVWKDSVRKIKDGDFEHFIKASDHRIGHIRPKARDSNDLMEAPDGTMQKKKCFWLNNSYIRSIILK